MNKTILLVRLGAWGDLIQCSQILPYVSLDYDVVFHCKSNGQQLFQYNPYIKRFSKHDESVEMEDLDKYIAEISKSYDKAVDLSALIEVGLLKQEGTVEFDWPHERRHAECNRNYFDRINEAVGYPHLKGLLPQLHFSPPERIIARDFRKKHRKNFMVMWGLSGSSFHKSYPHTEIVMRAFKEAHPETIYVTVGDAVCCLIEPDYSYVIQKSAQWPIRRAFLMTEYADLVISPETALLSAVGCCDTPKIALLSHSSVENLTKYFRNCVNLFADVPCYPCHQLHYTNESCPLDVKTQSPVCMSKISPATLLNAMEDVYKEWKDGGIPVTRDEAILCGRKESVCA